MNVNSDDDAQTRATSSTAIACARIPPPWPPYVLGEREAREAGVAPRVPALPRVLLALVGLGRVRRDVVLGEPPQRRPQLDVLVGKDERAHARSGATSCGCASASTRLDAGRTGVCSRRSVLGHRVDERAAARVAVRRPRARVAARCVDERVVGDAVVAEQRDRDVDVADHRRPPERRGALARDLGDHRDRRRRRARCGASRSRSLRPLRERVGVADVRAGPAEQRAARAGAPPEVAGPIGAPVARGRRRDARRQVLLLARPGVGIGRNERDRWARPPAELSSAGPYAPGPQAGRSGSSRAAPATTPR